LLPAVDVKCFVVTDNPGAASLRHITNAQLLIIGNRSANLLTNAMLGSTSLNMLHHCRVPVVLCPMPSR
jgi:nucleotide-binding universal stress UspA family protein